APTNTSTAITASDNSPVYGEILTYTATITAVPPSAGAPADGTVTFSFDTGPEISTHFSEGQAKITHRWLTTGSAHTVDAKFDGDDSAGEFIASTAPQLTVTVGQ